MDIESALDPQIVLAINRHDMGDTGCKKGSSSTDSTAHSPVSAFA